jgi:hypothetical protein
MTIQTALFYRFGVALFIGILVGLQREFTYDTEEKADKRAFAGVRTFSLLALLGAAGAYASDLLDSPFVFLGVTLVFGSLITVAYFVTSSRGDVGMTTEVAAVLIFFAGALSYWIRWPWRWRWPWPRRPCCPSSWSCTAWPSA